MTNIEATIIILMNRLVRFQIFIEVALLPWQSAGYNIMVLPIE